MIDKWHDIEGLLSDVDLRILTVIDLDLSQEPNPTSVILVLQERSGLSGLYRFEKRRRFIGFNYHSIISVCNLCWVTYSAVISIYRKWECHGIH